MNVIANQICDYLRDLAAGQGVRVLYACESGSRAWGVASTDSDWDIRFIYVKPIEEYLRLHFRKDTIKRMYGDLDYSGWDLHKALCLAAKSNPSLIEWLQSPITYVEDVDFVRQLKSIMEDFSEKSLAHHYVSLASRQVKAYWRDGKSVRFKKYIYAVRPLMCAEWMIEHGGIPPMDFGTLCEQTHLPDDVQDELAQLLTMKAETTEYGGSGRFKGLDRYINCGLVECREFANRMKNNTPDIGALDCLFREQVQ